MELSPREWLEVVRRDYLEDFIREGGAAVKFVVADGGVARATVGAALRVAAEDGGFQFVTVDAASTKVQLIDRLFHAVARQIDWDRCTTTFPRQSLEGVAVMTADPAFERYDVEVVPAR